MMSSEAPAELFEPEVMALFDRYRKPLVALYNHYAALSAAAAAAAAAADDHAAAAPPPATGLDCRRFVELFADFDIAPTFVTKRELKQIFAAASRAHGGAMAAASPGAPSSPEGTAATADAAGAVAPLSYAAFVEALGRTALVALFKPAFQHLYPTARDKVSVLLEMWSVADPRKLQDIQRARAHGHGGAAKTHASPSKSSRRRQ
jgi:hypothetical protein